MPNRCLLVIIQKIAVSSILEYLQNYQTHNCYRRAQEIYPKSSLYKYKSQSCGRFRGVQGLIEPPFTHLLAPELTPLFLWNPSSNPSHNPQSTLTECTTSNSFRIIIFCPLYMEYKETCFNLKSEASIIFYLTSWGPLSITLLILLGDLFVY